MNSIVRVIFFEQHVVVRKAVGNSGILQILDDKVSICRKPLFLIDKKDIAQICPPAGGDETMPIFPAAE